MPQKAEQVYNALKESGYEMDSKNANEFYTGLMANPSKADIVYKALLEDGYHLDSKSPEEFQMSLGLKKKGEAGGPGFLSVDWIIQNTPGYYSPSESEGGTATATATTTPIKQVVKQQVEQPPVAAIPDNIPEGAEHHDSGGVWKMTNGQWVNVVPDPWSKKGDIADKESSDNFSQNWARQNKGYDSAKIKSTAPAKPTSRFVDGKFYANPQDRPGMKLNPFFQTPTLDRPDITAMKQEQALGGVVATAEEGKTIQKFLSSPTIEELDDEKKKDVLDQVFAGKETELNIAGKLDDAAKNKLARERTEFSQRFYNSELSGEDIELIKQSNPIAFPKQYDNIPSAIVAQGINNKTSKLNSWARGVNEGGADAYAIQRKELESQKATRQEALDAIVNTNYIVKQGDRYIAENPEKQYLADQANGLQQQIDDTDLKLSYVNRDFDVALYQPHENKLLNESVLGRVQQMYGGMRPEDIYKWEGGMRMTDDDSMSEEQQAALKKLHNDPNFKLGDIIKYDETNHLTPESVVKLRELVTQIVNKDGDPIVEAHEHGETGRTMRRGVAGGLEPGVGVSQDVSQQGAVVQRMPINPEDLIKRTINYFNYELPAKVLAEGYSNKWKKTAVGQQVAPFLDAQKKINANNTEVAKIESAIKTSLDAGYLSINDKYSKILAANPQYQTWLNSWQHQVKENLISPQQAEIEFLKTLQNDPVVKPILDAKNAEVDKLRNTANTQREQYLIAGGKVDPNLVIDESGRLTVKGMTREQLDAAMSDYQKGYEQELTNTYKGQEDFLVKKADMINTGMKETFGRFGGAFLTGVTGAVDDLGAATSRWLYHKTGLAGDAMNYFEGERQRPLNIGEYATNHYTYKGLESLMDPAYYGFASGQSYPYAAPALVLGAATGGSAAAIIGSSIAGATLETAENALLTRNELFMDGRDKNGLKITSQEADRVAAQQFRDELVPNITFQALELGALLRTAKYAKPAMGLKAVGRGVADVVAAGVPEAFQEGVQGYVQAGAKQQATEGTKLDLFDYLQTDDFVQNFFGGFAGGVTMGGGVKPMAYANSIRNWQAMIKESQAAFGNNARNDFARDVPYANALHAEIGGTSAEFRDGIRLRLQNDQYKDEREKENLKRALSYSEGLSKSVKREGIVPENINELYAAHSVALADMYESLAEADKESSQGKLYAQQAKTFRQQSVDALAGDAKFYYAIDASGRPIFMSEKTANVMGAAKSFEKMKRAGQITEVGAVNDDNFNKNIADVANATPAYVQPAAPQEDPIESKWKANIRAISERTDIGDVTKQAMMELEDKRHAQEIADLATDQRRAEDLSISARIIESSNSIINYNKNRAESIKEDIRKVISGENKAEDLELFENVSAAMQFTGEDLTKDVYAEFDKLRKDYNIDSLLDQLSEIQKRIAAEEASIQKIQAIDNKTTTDDTQNIPGVPGAVREGQEPVQTEPVQSSSAQEAGGGGVVQSTPEEEQVVAAATTAGVTLTPDEVEDVATIVAASEETDTPMTAAEAVEFHEREKGNKPVVAEAVIAPGNKFVSELDGTKATIVSTEGDNVTVAFDGQAEHEVMTKADFDELFNPAPAVQPEATEQKTMAPFSGDTIRDLLKVNLDKLTGGGGIQSNILGIPVAIWNGIVESVALLIDGGMSVQRAIRRGFEDIRKDYKDVEELAVIGVLNRLTEGLTDKPVRGKDEKYGAYSMRVLQWRKDMLAKPQFSAGANVKAQSQAELTFVKNVNAGIEALKGNMKMTNEEFNKQLGLPKDDRMTYVGALKYLQGTNKEATATLNELRKENPTMVAMSELALLKKQYKDWERGYKAGDKESTDRMNDIKRDITALLHDYNEAGLFKGIKYTPQELLRMASYVNGAVNEKTLDNFKNMVQGLIEKADYGRKVAAAKALQKQVKDVNKKKTAADKKIVTANMQPVIKDLANLNALRVSDIDKYNEMMTDVVESQYTKDRPIPAFTREALIDFIAKEKAYDIEQTGKEVMDKYYDVSTDDDVVALTAAGKIKNLPVEQAIQNVVNGMVSNAARSHTESIKELNAVYEQLNKFSKQVKETAKKIKDSNGAVSAQDVDAIDYNESPVTVDDDREDNRKVLEDMARAQQDAIDTTQGYTDEQKKTLDTLKSLDVTDFDANKLRAFMNVINNVIMNEDFSGDGIFTTESKAQDNIKKLFKFFADTGRKIKSKREARTIVRKGLQEARRSLASTEQEVLEVTSNDPASMIEVMKAVEFDKIKKGWAKTVAELKEKLTQKLQDLLDSGAIDTKDARSQWKLNMYSWLNQSKTTDTELEKQAEFAKRWNEIKEDIAIKEASGKESNVAEAAVLKDIYEELAAKIKNTKGVDVVNEGVKGHGSELLNGVNFLTPGEQQAYDIIRQFHDEARPQFIDTMERLLNKEFVGYDNYMVDKTRKLMGGLAGVKIEESQFFQETDKESVDDESGSFAGRIEGNRIKRPLSGQDTRVIDYDFFNHTISNARDTLYDINTLEDRIVAGGVVSSKEMQDGVGHVKAEMLKKNLAKEIQGAIGFNRDNADGLKLWAQTSNTLARLSAKANLYSLKAFPKQAFSAMMNTAVFLGVDAPYIGVAARLALDNPWVKKILSGEEISLRDKTQAGTNIGAQDVINDRKGALAKTDVGKAMLNLDKLLSNQKEFTGEQRKLMGLFLEAGDVYGAKATWIALYAKYLKNNGYVKNLFDIDWKKESENINRDAAIFASVTTSAQLNTNSKNAMGTALLKGDVASAITRSIYGLFATFGINKSINNYTKFKNVMDAPFDSSVAAVARLFTGQISKESGQAQIDYAVKGIVAGFFEDLMFASVNLWLGKMTIMAIGQMLMGAIGDKEGEEELKKIIKAPTEDMWGAAKQTVAQATGNFLFSFAGNYTQDKLQKAVNWIHEMTGGDKKIFYEQTDNPNYQKDQGLFASSGLADKVNDFWRIAKLNMDDTDVDGNPIDPPSPEVAKFQKIYTAVALIHDMLQLFGAGDADVERIINRRTDMIDAEIGKRRHEKYWMDIGNPTVDELTIAGALRDLTDEQAKYYKQQRTLRMKQIKDWNMTDEKKMKYAVDFAKAMLVQKFTVPGLKIKPPEEKKKE